MFSQFRQAVEGFAPPPPRRGSQDTARSGSPGPSGHLPKSNSLSDARGPRPKSNLEERLRAKLAAAESSRAASAPIPVTRHPLSPTSTPLPSSPALSPAPTSAFEVDDPLSLNSVGSPTVQSPSQKSPTPRKEGTPDESGPPDESTEKEKEVDTLELPQASPVADTREAAPPILTAESEAKEEVTLALGEPPLPLAEPNNDQDVDSLQKRLKLVEQRFAGMYFYLLNPVSLVLMS